MFHKTKGLISFHKDKNKTKKKNNKVSTKLYPSEYRKGKQYI